MKSIPKVARSLKQGEGMYGILSDHKLATHPISESDIGLTLVRDTGKVTQLSY